MRGARRGGQVGAVRRPTLVPGTSAASGGRRPCRFAIRPGAAGRVDSRLLHHEAVETRLIHHEAVAGQVGSAGMTRLRAVAVPALLAAAAALAGAGCGGPAAAPSPQHPASSSAQPKPVVASSAIPPSTPGASTAVPHRRPARPAAAVRRKHHRARVFTAKVTPVEHRSQVRYSWHPGCPVAFTDLRMITMTYRGSTTGSTRAGWWSMRRSPAS